MAVTATASNRAKYALARKTIDLQDDSIRAILMRQGFVFNKDDHATRLNLKGYLAGTTISINASLQILDSGNGFLTAGLVPGNKITMSGWTNGGNNTSKVILTVTAGTITVTDTSSLVQESAGNMVAIQAADELPTGNGYSENGVLLTGQAVIEDDANDRAQMICNNIDFSASGGSVGPSPGALLYDDTVTEKTIIGYLDFGGDQTIADGNKLRLENVRIRIS
jgi:hypothetical protein